jgi:hypothetical protein
MRAGVVVGGTTIMTRRHQNLPKDPFDRTTRMSLKAILTGALTGAVVLVVS